LDFAPDFSVTLSVSIEIEYLMTGSLEWTYNLAKESRSRPP
jgi:hypothetical protein